MQETKWFVLTPEEDRCPVVASPGFPQVCPDPREKESPHLCLLFRTTRQGTLLQGLRQPPPCRQRGTRSQRRTQTPRSSGEGRTPSATHPQVQRENSTCRTGGRLACAPHCSDRAPASSAGELDPLFRTGEQRRLSPSLGHSGVKM